MADRKAILNASNPLGRRPQLGELTEALLPQIVQSSDGGWLFKSFKLTTTGFQISGKLTFEEWKAAGELFGQTDRSRNWWIGDWLTVCESSWGDKYRLAVDITGLTPDALSNIASVCSKVQLPFRNGNLSFSHHVVVAPEIPEMQDRWLKQAEKDNLSVIKLRRLIAEEKARQAGSGSPVIVERSPLAAKVYPVAWKRLWHAVEADDIEQVSIDDCDRIIDWATAIKDSRLEHDQEKAQDTQQDTSGEDLTTADFEVKE